MFPSYTSNPGFGRGLSFWDLNTRHAVNMYGGVDNGVRYHARIPLEVDQSHQGIVVKVPRIDHESFCVDFSCDIDLVANGFVLIFGSRLDFLATERRVQGKHELGVEQFGAYPEVTVRVR